MHRLLTWALLLSLGVGCAGRAPEPPNIVLIVSDDHSWPDYGFMGSDVARTPNLDALARGGVVFTHAFNSGSHCFPSLRTLLTGLHPLQFDAGVRAAREAGAAVDGLHDIGLFETLPERLAQRGYVSFQGGKYWEGSYRDGGFTHGMTDPDALSPDQRQQMQRLGLLNSSAQGRTLGRQTMRPLFEFLDAHAERRFFVWFAPLLPHSPFNPTPQQRARYSDRSEFASGYFANIERLDDRVGELLAYLDAKGLRDETLVVYLSDNGWDSDPPIEGGHIGGPRGKLSMYEKGFRTPLILSWPGTLAEGVRRGELVSTVDLVATLLDLGGAPAVEGALGASLRGLLFDGEELVRGTLIGAMRRRRNASWKLESGREIRPPEERAYFARTPEWRYVWYADRDSERLHRIREDPFEQEDVAAEHPEVARQLRDEIERWQKKAMRPPPGPPPARQADRG